MPTMPHLNPMMFSTCLIRRRRQRRARSPWRPWRDAPCSGSLDPGRVPGLVHECPGQKKLHALAAQCGLRCHALKTAAPRREAVALGNGVDRHEADVVTVASILFAGISQPDEKPHDEPSVCRLTSS